MAVSPRYATPVPASWEVEMVATVSLSMFTVEQRRPGGNSLWYKCRASAPPPPSTQASPRTRQQQQSHHTGPASRVHAAESTNNFRFASSNVYLCVATDGMWFSGHCTATKSTRFMKARTLYFMQQNLALYLSSVKSFC